MSNVKTSGRVDEWTRQRIPTNKSMVLSEELAIDYKELTGRSTVQAEGISTSKLSQNQTHISMKRKRCQIAQCTNNKANSNWGTCHKRVCGKCSAKITKPIVLTPPVEVGIPRSSVVLVL
ncbi:hypothetical protein GQX74_011472 [Glossina fuscipes]|nr:hypothetical protein GQX74_011472 [Glossina fuscipes]